MHPECAYFYVWAINTNEIIAVHGRLFIYQCTVFVQSKFTFSDLRVMAVLTHTLFCMIDDVIVARIARSADRFYIFDSFRPVM